MIRFFSPFFAACLLAICPGAASEPENDLIHVPFDPATGKVVRYAFVRSDSRTDTSAPNGIRTGSADWTMRLEVIERTETGFLMSAQYETFAVALPAELRAKASQDELDEATEMMELIKTLKPVFSTDSTGYPIRIENWEEARASVAPLLEATRAAIEARGQTEEERQRSVAVFDAVTRMLMFEDPAAATQAFLRDVYPLFALTGLEAALGDPVPVSRIVPWALTGTTLLVEGDTRIVTASETQVHVQTSLDFNRDSVLQGLSVLMLRVFEEARNNMSLEASERVEASLREIEDLESYNVSELWDARLSLADGWPDTLSYTRQAGTNTGWAKIELNIKRID